MGSESPLWVCVRVCITGAAAALAAAATPTATPAAPAPTAAAAAVAATALVSNLQVTRWHVCHTLRTARERPRAEHIVPRARAMAWIHSQHCIV